ncbi:cell division protein FtsQ/DivIB [Streptococcus sp. DD13]|uniref:cell division protein FtsQ/DivIB n=1 Tax=Streptococcus sp. DD13 TaxID=1777881 RepID=UPI00079C37B7|nr:FtsQ-type POTRA domain-containing protein [Streptococcus sp. DD13]KXT79286.1 Cell division protein FtsQ [Streptococcus sp. DD13]
MDQEHDKELTEEQGQEEFQPTNPAPDQEEGVDTADPEEQSDQTKSAEDSETSTENPGNEVVETEDNQETDDLSEFFQTWRKRHDEFLNRSINEETEELEVEEVPALKRKGRFRMWRRRETESGQETEEKRQARKRKWDRSIDEYLKMTLVTLVFLSGGLLSIYFLSPLSKQKVFTVQGNQQVTLAELGQASQVKAEDYALSTLVDRHNIERNIVEHSPWVESATISYQFPNRFEIKVVEYVGVGYVKNGQEYHQLLSSGSVLSTKTVAKQLPETYTEIDIRDSAILPVLGKELGKLSPELRQKISTIKLTPSKATANLLTFEMTDGNRVLIPASEIEKKMAYYNRIAQQLEVPSVIDMEIGIFSYAIS